MRSIDLNADLGEGYGPWRMGDDAAMLDVVTSANVACGGHAGDPDTMYETCVAAAQRGVVIGAHPSFADREGFGRRVIPMTTEALGRMVIAQVGSLCALANAAGTDVRYVKPHGALANLAASDTATAAALVDCIRTAFPTLAILAISGTELERTARAAAIPVFSEVFADRAYLPDGQLVPRSQAGAVLHDADEVLARLTGLLGHGSLPHTGGGSVALRADSICVHGDTPGAVDLTTKVRALLVRSGVTLRPFVEKRPHPRTSATPLGFADRPART